MRSRWRVSRGRATPPADLGLALEDLVGCHIRDVGGAVLPLGAVRAPADQMWHTLVGADSARGAL
eukprot:7813854-Lingulodinium_polyedra.AAC.1